MRHRVAWLYNVDPAFVDRGLGGFLDNGDYDGMQKVPTLRNVAKKPNDAFVKAFTHNGYFKTLKGVVHFYNTRDTKPVCANPMASEADALAQGCRPPPEVPENVNDSASGNLGLTDAEEDALLNLANYCVGADPRVRPLFHGPTLLRDSALFCGHQ